MTGLEKLYNIVRKEQNVLNTSIYAWNGQRNYNMVEYNRARMDELRWIKRVIEDIHKEEGFQLNGLDEYIKDALEKAIHKMLEYEHKENQVAMNYYAGQVDILRELKRRYVK